MNIDKVLAHSVAHWAVGGGDTGRGGVERIGFLQVGIHSLKIQEMGSREYHAILVKTKKDE
jgi:hypothetical protein